MSVVMNKLNTIDVINKFMKSFIDFHKLFSEVLSSWGCN